MKSLYNYPAANSDSRPLDLISRICSHCSHLLGGIWARVKAWFLSWIFKTKAMNEDSSHCHQEDTEETRAEQLLDEMEPEAREQDRLQLYDPEERELWFACGDGRKTVFVSSGKTLRISQGFESKLGRDLVKRFRRRKVGLIDGKRVLTQLQSTVREYVHFRDERIYLFQSVWIVGTHLYSMFSHFGYLFFYSKKMRSGKTLNQQICSHLAYEVTAPLNSPTPAVIRDLARDGGTLQLDTLERWREKNYESYSTAMDLLDAGFRKGGTVAKKVPSKVLSDQKTEWQTEKISVYTPYVLAAIHLHSISDTALDRSFPIEMSRKPLSVKKKRYNYFQFEKECRSIRDDLYMWALQNASQLATAYDGQELETEVDRLQLNDRATDIWRSIFAVLWTLGFGPETQEWEDLSTFAQDMHHAPEVAEAHRQIVVLQALRERNGSEEAVRGTTTDLVNYLRSRDLQMDHTDFNELMNEWEFEQRTARLDEYETPRRAWVLDVERLSGIEKELLTEFPYTPEMVTTVTTSGDLQEPTDPDLNGDAEDQEDS